MVRRAWMVEQLKEVRSSTSGLIKAVENDGMTAEEMALKCQEVAVRLQVMQRGFDKLEEFDNSTPE